MKRFIATSVCTLGLTLLGAFGNNQNSLNLSNELNAVNTTTKVEQNITNLKTQQSLPSESKSPVATIATEDTQLDNIFNSTSVAVTGVKSAFVVNSDMKKAKEVKASSNKLANTLKNKTKKSNAAKLTYKNVDLSKCYSTKEVVKELQENGYTNITTSNIKNIKALKNILAYINESNKKPTLTPTTAPSPTTKPTPTTAPAPTTKPTPTTAPAPTTKPTPTTAPAPTTKPTPTTAPAPTTKPTPTTAPTPTTQPTNPSDVSSYANQVLQLVNKERANAGLSALTTNSTLQAAANKRAEETVQSFSHTRPNGTSFSTVLKEYGVSYRAAGENIAYGQKSPQEVVTGWMNSPGHRANIMNTNFGKIGIGVYKSNGIIYWSQLFTN